MSYEPSQYVRSMHASPHINIIDNRLVIVDNQFAIENGAYWNQYSKSLLPFPVIIACLETLVLIIVVVGICTNWFHSARNAKTAPTPVSTSEEEEVLIREKKSTSNYVLMATVFFALWALVTIQTLVFADRSMHDATHNLDDNLDYMYDVFSHVRADGEQLVALGTYMDGNLSKAVDTDCYPGELAQSNVDDFNEQVQKFSDSVDPLPGYLDSAYHGIHQYGKEDKSKAVWSVYAVSMVPPLAILTGLCVGNKLFLQFDIALTAFITELLIVLLAGEMVALVRHTPSVMLFLYK
jgi:hypothetical protein